MSELGEAPPEYDDIPDLPTEEGTWIWNREIADWVRVYDGDGITLIGPAMWPPANVEIR